MLVLIILLSTSIIFGFCFFSIKYFLLKKEKEKIEKEKKENEKILNKTSKAYYSAIKNNVDIIKDNNELKQKNKKMHIALAVEDLKDIMEEEKSLLDVIVVLSSENKELNKDSIIFALEILEKEKNAIILSLKENGIDISIPSVINDKGMVMYTTVNEYLDKYKENSASNFLCAAGIVEDELEVQSREAKIFFSDLIKNNLFIKDTLPVIINKNKH